MNSTIRRATENDKDFLITSIIEAEKSGAGIISYCAIFSITEDVFRGVLSNMLDEDVEGQELCISNFLIFEIDGERAAAVSAWVEGAGGIPSNIIKSNLLMSFIDRQVLLNAAPALGLMNEINIARTGNALQIECVYTAAKFRGMGLSGRLINEHIRLQQNEGMPIDKVQVILLKNNSSAVKAYEKAGFSVTTEKKCSDKAIFNLLPGDTKVLMERKLKA